jgi:hypothetical protein
VRRCSAGLEQGFGGHKILDFMIILIKLKIEHSMLEISIFKNFSANEKILKNTALITYQLSKNVRTSKETISRCLQSPHPK